MTVSSTTSRVTYAGDGASTAFPIPFRFLDQKHIVALLKGETALDQTLVLGSDYTLAGVDNPNGGTLTKLSPLLAGRELTITRQVTIDQGTDYVPNDPFPAEGHERALDKLTMIAQQQAEAGSRALTVPATDVVGGAPAPIPTRTQRALRVLGFDVNGNPVAGPLLSQLATITAFFLNPVLTGVASAIGYTASNVGVVRSIEAKIRNYVDVTDYDARGDGVTDDSAAFAKALATGRAVYVPKGDYLVNLNMPERFTLYGDNSADTIIRPYSASLPAITINLAPFWGYAREIRNIQFAGRSPKTGIGVSHGKGNPAAYVANDEFANSVTFRNCKFTGLDKGVQASCGNLGLEFYSCNWQSNRYGCYFIDAKFGGTMHAGCKYFFGGELDYNDVGVYVHNRLDGFGGIAFHSTIIEANGINVYLSVTGQRQPISFYDVWTEGAGPGAGLGATITVDVWTGTTKTTAAVPAHAYVIEGEGVHVDFVGGFLCDVFMTATNSRVTGRHCGVETTADFGGAPFTVTGAGSEVVLDSPYSVGGVRAVENTYVRGAQFNRRPAITAIDTALKQFNTTPRYNKQTGMGLYGAARQDFTASKAALGAFGTVGNVAGAVVADGMIYPNCNEYVLPFTGGSFYVIDTPGLTPMVDGRWYVTTIDVRAMAGQPLIFVGDLNVAQLMGACPVPQPGWATLAALGQCVTSSAGGSLGLQISTAGGACTVRLSAWQVVGFETRRQAEAYLEASIFLAG